MVNQSFSLALLMLAGVGISAQPVISNISNELIDSSGRLKVVITGSQFGEGPEVLYYVDLDGVGDNAPLSAVDRIPENTAFGTEVPKVTTYQRQKGFAIVNEETKQYSIIGAQLGKSYSDIFVAYSVAIPKGRTAPSQSEYRSWGASTWKLAWLLESGGAYSDQEQFDLCVPTQVGNNTMLSGNANTYRNAQNDRTYVPTTKSSWWAWDTFNHISVWLDVDSDDYKKSKAKFSAVNTEFGLVDVDIANNVYLDGPPPKVTLVNFPGWVRKSDEDNFQAVYANLYVSGGENFLARVELTDNLDYEKSKYRKLLKPDSWEASKIETSFHKSTLSVYGNLYIHVFDSNNTRVAKGRIACQICPALPQQP